MDNSKENFTIDSSDVIFGKNSIIEALTVGTREINKIWISKSIHTDNKIEQIKTIAQQKGIIFQFVGKENSKTIMNLIIKVL